MTRLPFTYPAFARSAARPRAAAALRLMAERRLPGEFSAGLAGFSAAPPSGGILPVNQWAQADAAVATVWDIYAKLDAKVNGGWLPSFRDQSVARTALANMNARIKDWAARLEVLKHGPLGPNALANPQQAVEEWKAWGAPSGPTSFNEWARQIDDTANFNSVWGMVKDVTAATARDVAKGVQNTGDSLLGAGKGALFIVKYAPWIALAGGGVLVYLWGRRLVDPMAEGIRSVSTAASHRIDPQGARGVTPRDIPSGGVAGYRPRRRRRKSSRRRRS